ncbi:uncharacterized protein LOC6576476 [Drosophila mojavensis]|uniref:Lipid-binding serum glycoprotein N-terminal domain-containing protein n=1 Tax=Drosophila mojavensis TaxID=7230 RepID=B4KEM8_DROMO|nr:uncharacterized protein LOC6576476 [Drosophila mojavensis]EDW11907.1 uncharacterized protein Dmoj_GI12614 [Drosophila mojavensis]
MRSLFLVLIALLGCSLSSGRVLFDDDLRELTEFLRLQMQCGYPAKGIPILAPAQLSYKEVDIQADAFSGRGNFTNISIVGLDSFEFSQLQWSNIFHTIKFDVSFPSIRLKAENYKFDLRRFLGATASNKCDGVFDVELLDVRANGSFVLRPSSLTNGIHVTRWNVDWQLGNAISQITGTGSKYLEKFINSVLQDFLQLLINDNPEEISQFMEQLLVAPLNTVFGNVAWYEITAIILGLVNDVLPVEPIC